MLALLASIWSGGLQHASDWASQRFVEVFVIDKPGEPAPTEPAEHKRRQQDQKAKQQDRAG